MGVMRPDEATAESPGWESLEQLFAALEAPLLSYALRLTGGREVAEDVVQEAFMKLHAQFDQVEMPRRWLYRTVHNLALNQRRQSAKVMALHPAGDPGAPGEDATPDPAPLPDEQIIRLEGIGLVRICLAALEPRSRELIRLKFNEELSYQEISTRTGLSVGNVGYLLHHALKTIGQELAKSGVLS
jgi:RNA polymerase sigma-70 factor (ECF subfamily)